MKKIAVIAGRLLVLLIASASAALFLCLLSAFIQRPDAAKIAAVQQELDRTCYRIEAINERISLWEKRIEEIDRATLAVRIRYYFAVPAWKAKIVEYRTVTLPALELQKIELKLAQRGFEESFGEKFLTECSRIFLPLFASIFLILLILPLTASLAVYFIFARFAEKHPPVYLPDTPVFHPDFRISEAAPLLNIKLSGTEHFYLRPAWCRAKNSISTAGKLFWNWKAPLVSFAAGLFELADLSADGSNCGEFTVSPPADNLMIAEITLNGQSSIILRPRHLIGVTDGIKIRTFWNFSIHNLITGKLRQVQFYGKGRILIAGAWGINSVTVTGHPHLVDEKMLIAISGDGAYTVHRSGTWWHYFRRKSSLFSSKIVFGTFVLQNHQWDYRRPGATWMEKFVNLFLNGVGSFLGL